MRIEGFNGINQSSSMNTNRPTDAVSKSIQKQIANAQKQLQELSANKDISIEEKMKKRQEIQQQITDLNNQLRQHQIEMRREQQQAKKDAQSNNTVAQRSNKQNVGLSQESMQAIISADGAISAVQSQGAVATKMEGRAGVLKSEIKLDTARGNNVESKQEELAEVEQKANAVQEMQITTLSSANKELALASKSDEQTEAVDKDTEKKDDELSISENKAVDVSTTATYEHMDVYL